MQAAPPPRLLFDIETNGLYDEVSTIHCLVTYDLGTGEVRQFRPHEIVEGLKYLNTASYLSGHNIIDYDCRVIDKLHPGAVDWSTKKFMDTLTASKLIFSNIRDSDWLRAEKGELPKFLIGRHSLQAWGYRLKAHKDDYSARMKEAGLDPWAAFSEEMLAYCVKDVELNVRLWKAMRKRRPDPRSIELEMEVAEIILEQERNGFPFNEAKAAELYGVLAARRQELLDQCAELFPPWYVGTAVVTTTKGRRMKRPELGQFEVPVFHKSSGKLLRTKVEPVYEEFVEGTEHTKVRLVTFNPSSRQHVADRLQKLYDWKPVAFGGDGVPTVDDEILKALPYPPAKLLAEYYMVEKRIGQVAEGNQAWLKKVRKGRIHGRVNTNGAVTGRATHSDPNVAQVPSCFNADGPVPYGKECRELFGDENDGWPLVGADASGLELRGLGHALAPYDGGSWAATVVSGDIHWQNVLALGLLPPGTVRDKHNDRHEWLRSAAKTWIYAFLYGAGGWKLGAAIGLESLEERNQLLQSAKPGERQKAQRELDFLGIPATKKNLALSVKGQRLKASFLKRTPALKQLQDAIAAEFKATGTLTGLDGRILYCRSKHSALNTRLQSDGAIICKRWLVEMHREFKRRGWKNGVDYRQCAWVHDEVQIRCRPEIAEELGQIAVECVKRAGEYFDYRCPLTGEFKIGRTWADTH